MEVLDRREPSLREPLRAQALVAEPEDHAAHAARAGGDGVNVHLDPRDLRARGMSDQTRRGAERVAVQRGEATVPLDDTLGR